MDIDGRSIKENKTAAAPAGLWLFKEKPLAQCGQAASDGTYTRIKT
jgi:hypothetical protein